MAVPSPDAGRLAELGPDLGLTPAELDEFVPAVAASLGSVNAVVEMYAAIAPVAPERAWEPAEHPLNGWYVTTDISDPDAADGPLAGRTVAIKDNITLAGVPMMNGSTTLEGFVPTRDATVVQRVLAAGGRITGKSVCEDLCYSCASITSKNGFVRNPWDPTRISGGSSSGSAVLVAVGDVDLALGGDQAGSIRMPAAFSGIVGHKPTFGLVPYTGAFPIEQTIDHLGPMARTVADTALLLNALAGVDGHDPRQPDAIAPVDYVAALAESTAGLRVGVVTEGFGRETSEAGVDASVRAAIEVLRGAGMTIGEVSIPWHLDGLHPWAVIGVEGVAYQMIDSRGYGMNFKGLYDPEMIAHFHRGMQQHGPTLPNVTKMTALSGRWTRELGGGSYYAMARNLAPLVTAAYDAALAEFDVLVMPTVPFTARTLPEPDISLGEHIDLTLSPFVNTAPFNLTGHPAVSVPAELVDGLPAGLMIVGKHFDDATVLRVAHTYEQARGGFPMPPSVTAAAAAG